VVFLWSSDFSLHSLSPMWIFDGLMKELRLKNRRNWQAKTIVSMRKLFIREIRRERVWYTWGGRRISSWRKRRVGRRTSLLTMKILQVRRGFSKSRRFSNRRGRLWDWNRSRNNIRKRKIRNRIRQNKTTISRGIQ